MLRRVTAPTLCLPALGAKTEKTRHELLCGRGHVSSVLQAAPVVQGEQCLVGVG